MGFGLGVAWSLAGACAHTGIDALRKLGSGRIWPADLVALVAVFDAVISVVFVTVFEGWQPLQLENPRKFTGVMLCSSGLLLLSKLLYQKALHIAPLSLTVPYLSFTPAILVLVAYLLVGEVPTLWGTVGVCIVTLGGYLLSMRTSGTPAVEPGSPSKARPPPVTDGKATAALLGRTASSKLLTSFTDAVGGKSVWALKYNRQLRSTQSSDVEKGVSAFDLLLPSTPSFSITADASSGRPLTPRSRPSTPKGSSKGGSAAAATAAGGGGNTVANGLAGPWGRLQWLKEPAPSSGPFIVLTVAALWSVTASLDKIGINSAPSIWVYFLCQRATIGTACIMYLLVHSQSALRHIYSDFGLLLAISLLELGAVVFFLEAINNIFLSYVVAIKRINVLFSTIVGCVMFQESVGSRIPYILIMLSGMLLIVMQPGHDALHVTHRTV